MTNVNSKIIVNKISRRGTEKTESKVVPEKLFKLLQEKKIITKIFKKY